MVEFFIFAILMFVDTVIFMIMSMFYTYKVNSLDYTELVEESVEIDGSRKLNGEEYPLKSIPNPTTTPQHTISISSQS